jgi:hypothetical protein
MRRWGIASTRTAISLVALPTRRARLLASFSTTVLTQLRMGLSHTQRAACGLDPRVS